MKAVFYLIIGFLLVYAGCSEDFQLTEPYKDIPVVNGFINRYDTAQYIRVEKLFVDENIPATELAKRVDSVYYKNAVVKIFNLTKNLEFTLNKVEMSNEGYDRKPGPFSTMPNYMYKILSKDIVLNGGDVVELRINRGDNKPIVFSRITLLEDFDLVTPPKEDRQLAFKAGLSQSFTWKQTKDAAIYDFDVLINVRENNVGTGESVLKTLKLTVLKDGFKNSIAFRNNDFYNLLVSSLEPVPSLKRVVESVELVVRAGGNDLKSFNLLVNANLGITASQEIPRYTNMSEGFGIFSSIHVLKKAYGLTPETLRYLDTSTVTRALNFR